MKYPQERSCYLDRATLRRNLCKYINLGLMILDFLTLYSHLVNGLSGSSGSGSGLGSGLLLRTDWFRLWVYSTKFGYQSWHFWSSWPTCLTCRWGRVDKRPAQCDAEQGNRLEYMLIRTGHAFVPLCTLCRTRNATKTRKKRIKYKFPGNKTETRACGVGGERVQAAK